MTPSVMTFLYQPISWGLWIAQLANPGIDTPEEAALIFSGPQFFIALLAGVVLAFGFQMLLTNLSVAAGVTYLTQSSSSSSQSDSGGSPIRTVSLAVGLWTLITVTVALFIACFLAVKLSLYNSPLLGAITGLVIWGTYFSLLVWISSTTVGSLIGSVVKSATSSFQTIMGSATAAIGAKATSNQVVATAEAAAAAVRQELMADIHPEELKADLKRYIAEVRSPDLDIADLETRFEGMLSDSQLAEIADADTLDNIDRESFVQLISSRTDLSKREVNRIADRLYRIWQNRLQRSNPMSELVNYLRSARPEQLLSDGIGDRLDQLIEELRKNRRQQQQAGSSTTMNLLAQGFNTAAGVLMGRVDLSDMDVEQMLNQLQSARDSMLDQASTAANLLQPGEDSHSLIKADVENYLRHTYAWQLQGQRLESEFENVLYDAEADSQTLRDALHQLDRPFFVEILRSRGLFTQAEIKSISLRLEAVRQKVLRDVTAAAHIQAEKQLRRQLEIFLQLTPKEELFTDMGEDALRALAEDDDASAAELRDRFSRIDDSLMLQLLSGRADISEAEARTLVPKYRQILNRVVADSDSLQSAAQVRVQQQWQSVQGYLRSTNKSELNPEGIKRDLKQLLNEPDEGVRRIRGRLARFDRDTLTQLLSQRQDLSESDVNQIIDSVEENWQAALRTPARLSARMQASYNEATQAIADYLRSTGKPELQPEDIKRDLQKLLDNPKVGFKAMRSRLARMDRDTLVQLLSQRDDLSEAEVNQAIDDILSSIQSVLSMPRRLARRTQAQVNSFQAGLEDYLRSTEKSELHPEGIKRDLQTLVNDPRLGAERLGDRLAQVDRSTVVALLAQRNDMTEAEAQETVNRVLSVRDQMMAQLQSVQTRIEAVIDSLFARVRRYLNSLDREELNYDGIESDVRKLFDDPQAGFEALRFRLSQFDRNTLVALMSSHDSVSRADAERVIGKIESARDNVLRKAERLETQLQTRLNDIKLQTQKQFEDTVKAASAAAWWLFFTALVSGAAAAIAGRLAVLG
ncbi:MAG: MFS transporter [Leptolyngbya sp. SIO4C1]|nr:MFS transporter [Leptolyngbya sp. SIO4C1]